MRMHIPRSYLATTMTVTGGIGLLVYGRIPQFADYHAFADQRTVFGLPHAGDVLSNAGFAFVGGWGMLRFPLWRNATPVSSRPGWLLFLLALVMTAAGSGFYHLAPDNARLVWDRLPIALGCAGLLSAVRAESRPHERAWPYLSALVGAAVLSVLWWQWTDRVGRDDLRPYLFLQGLPLVLVPVWQAVGGAPRAERIAFAAAFLLYVAAKLAELGDHSIYGALGWISGHTIKHLLAIVAATIIVGQLCRRGAASPVRGGLEHVAAASHGPSGRGLSSNTDIASRT